MTNYATGTSVNSDRSRAEIETTLSRFGASGFGYYTDMTKRIAQIGFTHSGLSIRIEVSLPDPNDDEFTMRPSSSKRRKDYQAREAYEAEVSRRWRCLCLLVKAKLVAVEDRISTFEQEFLPYIVTSDGATVYDRMAPALEASRGKPHGVVLAITDGKRG